MRLLRVVSVLVFGSVVLGLGMLPARAEEGCAVAVLCPPPTVPAPPAPTPTPAPSPQPEPAPQPQPQPEPTPAPAPSAVEEGSAARLFELVNRTRVEHGLVPLAPHAGAASIAGEHSREMAARHDIWHNDDLFTKATKQRLGARSVAENVAINSSAEGAHERLLASEGHRANILTPGFTAGAVGAVRGDDGRLYVTQVFVAPAATASPAPSAPVAPASRKAARVPAAPAAAAPTSVVPADPTATAQAASPSVDQEPLGEPTDGAMELAAGLPFAGPVQRGPGIAFAGPVIVLAALALAGVVGALFALRRRSIQAA